MTNNNNQQKYHINELIGIATGAAFTGKLFNYLQNKNVVFGNYFKNAGSKPFSFKGTLLAITSLSPMVVGGLIGNSIDKIASLDNDGERDIDKTKQSVISPDDFEYPTIKTYYVDKINNNKNSHYITK